MARTPAPDVELLQAALLGYQQEIADIERRMAAIRQELGGRDGSRIMTPLSRSGRRVMSAAARRRVAAAQRKRWAAYHAEHAGPPPATKAAPARKKRRLSAAGRRAIAEASKKRWAAVRAQKAASEK